MQNYSPNLLAPLVCSVDEMRAMLGGIGTTKAFDLLRTGAVESVRIGARRMVKMDSIRRFIEQGGTCTCNDRAVILDTLNAEEA